MMKKSDIRVLIVDDELPLGKALSEALKKDGYQAKFVDSPEEARKEIRVNDYRVVLIDCLLPKTNGVDLAIEIKNKNSDIRIMLTSGIFKDKSFVRDSLQKSGAVTFLQKPFSIEDFLAAIRDAMSDLLGPERDALAELMRTPNASNAEIIKALEALENIHGFQLPYAYTLCLQAGASGKLILNGSTKAASHVTFHKGQITEVQGQDKKSYFGVLLVENGFASNEDVELNLEQVGEKPIGQRLVDANALSPHAIQIVLQEQMAIRLSKTIQNGGMEFSFKACDTEPSAISLDKSVWVELINDWVTSKIRFEWLKSNYVAWMDAPITMSKALNFENYKNLQIFKNLKDLPKLLSAEHSLQEIFELSSAPEEDNFRAIHFLFINRLIYFGEKKTTASDFTGKIRRLKQILIDQAKQDYFEVLGVNRHAHYKECNRAYLELAKALHPDKLDTQAPQELKDLTQKVFANITSAYETLSNDGKRADYVKTQDVGTADQALKSEALFESGLGLLNQGRYKLALEKFLEAANHKSHRSDLPLFISWCQLKIGVPANNAEAFLQEITKRISTVPPEDRHNAHFLFVKGLYHKAIGDYQKAVINFKHALTLDPVFLEAKRELAGLNQELKKIKQNQKNIPYDLSVVVGNLFKKSKKK